jgi:hypothetical protein
MDSAPPFNRFIVVAHSRGVCSSWRHAASATPGIWADLTIDVTEWCTAETIAPDNQTLSQQFRAELKPWIAILACNPPFHLTLTSSGPNLTDRLNLEPDQVQLVRYLLFSTPQPGAITLRSTLVVAGVMSLMTTLGVTLPALKLTLSGLVAKVDLKALQSMFPQLEAFEMSVALSLESPVPPFRHVSLQTLRLSSLAGEGVHLQHLIQQLPPPLRAQLEFR